MTNITKEFYTAMPNHCEEKTIRKSFNTALQRHMKKFKWTIEYQEARAQWGDYHDIIGYKHIRRTINTKFKTLFLAYKHSQTLEDTMYIEIKKNGKEGRTVVLPGDYIVWVENSYSPFIDIVDTTCALFTEHKRTHPTEQNIVLKILKNWWSVTPKLFTEYYPGLDLKTALQIELGSTYY